MTLYLSRLTLRRDPDVAALAPLVDPANRGRALDAHHRLIWTAFADHSDRRRDFLWRAEGRGRFMVLSLRPPAATALFEPPEVKSFAPTLAANDRLNFVLRANATRDRPVRHLERTKDGHVRDRRVDVVMDMLTSLEPCDPPVPRAEMREEVAQQAAECWIAKQGARHGFRPRETRVASYAVHMLPGHRGRRKGQPQFGVLDLSGTLEVSDPDVFLAKLAIGFGRAKAFGCGLMLIRRA